MCSRHHSRVYDDNLHKRKCNEEHNNAEHGKVEGHMKEHHKKDHDGVRHKKRHKEEHRKKDYDDVRDKKRHKEEHHKKHHVDDLHKKKHSDEHYKKDHNDGEIERKQDKNYYLENWLINFLKAANEEYNNNVPIENNGEDKNPDLINNDVLEEKLEEKNQDLSKADDLENNDYASFEDLNNEDFLKENNNSIEEEEDFLKESNNSIEEEEDFLKESNNSIEEEEDFLKESNNSIEEEEDFLKESNNSIEEEEDFLKESNNSIKEAHKKQADEATIMNCKTKVTSEMLPICDNVPHISEVTTGTVTVKIPVVLTECTVTITVESSLKLDDVVLEIKHIRKNVYLNQCKLIQSSEDGKSNTGILFIDGFIKTNIEYTTKGHNDKGVSWGKVKYATVKVPFKCTTIVMFKTYPKFKQSTYQDESEIIKSSIKVFNARGEDIAGGDIGEQSFKIIEFFNEKVFCELISAEILESNILENPISEECKIPLEQGIHDITEKVVLFLTMKLLQNQHVEISKKDQ